MKDNNDISKLLLNNITKHLPQYIFWKDANSIYLGCNDNYAFLHGLSSPQEIIGKSDYDLSWQSKGYTAEVFQEDDRKVISGQLILNKEEPLALPNGTTIITLISKRPIVDEDNVIIGIVGYFVDITERRQARQHEFAVKMRNQRKDLLEQFSRYDSVKEAVLAIAHEINQPLSAVANYASGCQKRLEKKYGDTLPVEIQVGLNKCITQARRAGHILHTLKDMLCYRNHHPELTSINALIENTVAILAEKIKETEAKLELHFDNNLSDIQCDRIQIELVIINLIKNACEAIVQQRINDKEKVIIISTESIKKNAIKITVENKTCTISKKIINKLFFPFYGTKKEGLGLGLTLSKNIVEQHNGNIEVHLTDIPSVRFEIILPLTK